MALTDVAIRNAKPRAKPYKMGDAFGLFMLIQPSGGKLWRFKYRFDGREKKLAIGTYPVIGLAEARRRRDQARELLAAGKDPSRERQREKLRNQVQAGNTFSAIAEEYCEKRKRDGQKAWAASTASRSEYLISLLKVPLGRIPIADIEPADVLAAVRKIERKGQLESARRTLQLAGAVFRYAVATARLSSDPTRDLRGALTAPTVTHYGAIIDPVRVGELLRAIDGYSTDEMTAHGFRAIASTLLNESGKWHPDAIERALAHGDSDRVRAAYHRGAHWKERVAMAQWWSDHLDQLRKGAEVVPIKAGKR